MGWKHHVHPEVGETEVLSESLPLQPDTGLSITAYPVEPGSSAEHRLAGLLA